MERRLAAILAADMVGYSRLMERDELGVLSRQKTYRRDLIDPEIARYRGRIVKTTGDGMLAEFASAQDAVRCSIDIQQAMHSREAEAHADDRIQYRVGVNLGDVIFDDDDIFGDGVNVASRLEGLAVPGGICISDSILQTVGDRVQEDFRDMGSQRVKNISRPIRVWQWSPRQAPRPEPSALARQQRVRFCTSADGTQIAWAAVGDGPALLRAPHWMTHIEYAWTNQIWGPLIDAFSERAHYVRFDQRGNGLSDWDVDRFSHDAMREDMEAVVEAAGLDRFALFAASQGAAFSVDYALAHPGRVTCIVFLGAYLRGRLARANDEQVALYTSAMNMIQQGWGSPNPLFRQFFTSSFVPEATPEQQASFDEAQRISTNTRNAVALFEMNARIDRVAAARRLDVPVLILHAVGDRVAPIEEGRLLARSIPGAQFIELPGSNHMPVQGTPAFDRVVEETTAFINAHA